MGLSPTNWVWKNPPQNAGMQNEEGTHNNKRVNNHVGGHHSQRVRTVVCTKVKKICMTYDGFERLLLALDALMKNIVEGANTQTIHSCFAAVQPLAMGMQIHLISTTAQQRILEDEARAIMIERLLVQIAKNLSKEKLKERQLKLKEGELIDPIFQNLGMWLLHVMDMIFNPDVPHEAPALLPMFEARDVTAESLQRTMLDLTRAAGEQMIREQQYDENEDPKLDPPLKSDPNGRDAFKLLKHIAETSEVNNRETEYNTLIGRTGKVEYADPKDEGEDTEETYGFQGEDMSEEQGNETQKQKKHKNAGKRKKKGTGSNRNKVSLAPSQQEEAAQTKQGGQNDITFYYCL
eukprot:m.254744 g.254744  ORF g.254744 m.254744 type:complete len:349 (+) comp16177_c0_seq12:66-1112(+)